MSARRSYILVIFCFISTIYSYGQSAGIAANFGIDSSIYSGSPDIDVDDWFQGLTGDGVIDETQTAFYLDNIDF